jgi:nucleotide-binding universal stress UspA family protein
MAKSIKKILIPTDFSPTAEVAMNQAAFLARLLRADLYLVHVLEYNTFSFSVVPDTPPVLPARGKLEKIALQKLQEEAAAIKKDHGIKCKMHVLHGVPETEILDFSKKNKISLIIMGTHGVKGYKEFFIGSNSHRVINISKIPVLTIQKKSGKAGFNNIVIPIDNSLHSREKVNMALEIADVCGSKIHVLGLPDSDEDIDLLKMRLKVESVEKILKKHKLPFKTSLVSDDNLADAAMNYAKKNKCDLIVINTGHESKLTGIFMGPFAKQIVNHSPIPVLSVNPTQGELITPSLSASANPFQ